MLAYICVGSRTLWIMTTVVRNVDLTSGECGSRMSHIGCSARISDIGVISKYHDVLFLLRYKDSSKISI